jgi:hypothetical protein
MSTPSPAERLAASLKHVPDACREILALRDRARAQGGGEFMVKFIVGPDGEVKLELPRLYSRRALEG